MHISLFEFLDPEHIGVAVGITFLSLLEAEIYLGVLISPVHCVRCFFFVHGTKVNSIECLLKVQIYAYHIFLIVKLCLNIISYFSKC